MKKLQCIIFEIGKNDVEGDSVLYNLYMVWKIHTLYNALSFAKKFAPFVKEEEVRVDVL